MLRTKVCTTARKGLILKLPVDVYITFLCSLRQVPCDSIHLLKSLIVFLGFRFFERLSPFFLFSISLSVSVYVSIPMSIFTFDIALQECRTKV